MKVKILNAIKYTSCCRRRFPGDVLVLLDHVVVLVVEALLLVGGHQKRVDGRVPADGGADGAVGHDVAHRVDGDVGVFGALEQSVVLVVLHHAGEVAC